MALAGRLLVVAVAMAVAGCSSDPIPVTLRSRPLPVRAATARKPLRFLPVVDGRPARDPAAGGAESLGVWAQTPDSVVRWVEEDAKRALAGAFELREPSDTAVPADAVGLVVRECYLTSVGGQMSVQVVLTVNLTAADGRRTSEVVRGQAVGSLWFSASAEVPANFRRALAQALRKVEALLARNG